MKVEEISQTIDSDNFSVQNSVLFSGPLTTTSVTTNAKFEVRSPKRFQVSTEEEEDINPFSFSYLLLFKSSSYSIAD